MIQHFKRPSAMRPGTSMPPIQLSDAQLNSLAAFLLKLNETQRHRAGQRARIRHPGRAGLPGEPLRRLPPGERRGHEDRAAAQRPRPNAKAAAGWSDHFADPQKLSPGTIMPPYKLSKPDLDNLTTYLFSLPEIQ